MGKRGKDLLTLAGPCAALLALYLATRWRPLPWLAAALALAALLSARLAAAAAGLWLAFAGRLGGFNARLLLGLVYFLALTPVALLRRLFEKDPLGRDRDPAAGSYFRAAGRTYSAADLEKTW